MDSQEAATGRPAAPLQQQQSDNFDNRNNILFNQEHKEHTSDESDDDFFADLLDDEDWSKLNTKSTDQDDTNNDMVMDLSAVFPVGGMRRVSSCYFSICSNISSDENVNSNVDVSSRVCDSPFTTDDQLTAAGTTSDFLYHDVLMNVFTYLDAASLAAFSETGKRPNFECFYFLELQLQRGLLRGTSANPFQVSGKADTFNELDTLEEDGLLFIAGTGAISRVSQHGEALCEVLVSCSQRIIISHIHQKLNI